VGRVFAETFARRFRSLSAAERLAFLAAVWEARGYDTRVEDGFVEASRREESIRIGVVGRLARNPPDSDLLVDTRDSRRLRLLADERGATVLPPGELRSLVLYGIDREVAEELVREHFGCSLSAILAEVNRDSAAGGSSATRSPVRPGILAVAVFAVFVLAGGAMAAGPGLGLLGGDTAEASPPDDGGMPDTVTDPVSVQSMDPTPSENRDDGSNGSDGDSDGDPLTIDSEATTQDMVERHRAQIGNQSYTLRVRYRKSANSTAPVSTLVPNVTRYARTVKIGNERRSSLSQSTVSERRNETIEIGIESYQQAGTVRTRVVETNDTAELANETYGLPAESPGPYVGFVTNVETLFAEALSAETTSVERIRRPDHPFGVFRVTAEGDPSELELETQDYHVAGEFTAGGQFVRLEITYVDPDTGDPVYFEVRIRDVGETSIDPPDWARR